MASGGSDSSWGESIRSERKALVPSSLQGPRQCISGNKQISLLLLGQQDRCFSNRVVSIDRTYLQHEAQYDEVCIEGSVHQHTTLLSANIAAG